MTRQRQTTSSSQESGLTFIPVGDGESVSFSGGVMHVAGVRQEPVRIAENQSSNGLTKYVAVIWRDPNTGGLRTSCNCAGWTIKRGRFRTCKHVQALQNNPEAGQSFEAAREAAVASPSSVAPRTVEIVESMGKARRSIQL